MGIEEDIVSRGPSYEMRILELLHNADIVQFDVQVLVYTLQSAADLNVVLELHGDFMVDEGLEEAVNGC